MRYVSVICLQFCLKYTLGLLYTNYNLLWTPCIEVIRQAGKSIEMGTFWETFGFHLCKNQNFPTKADECLRTSILPAVDEQCSGIVIKRRGFYKNVLLFIAVLDY